ncbi:MAG TPA: hypothetical protein VGD01_07940 [Candidatus Elarobacter sp.]
MLTGAQSFAQRQRFRFERFHRRDRPGQHAGQPLVHGVQLGCMRGDGARCSAQILGRGANGIGNLRFPSDPGRHLGEAAFFDDEAFARTRDELLELAQLGREPRDEEAGRPLSRTATLRVSPNAALGKSSKTRCQLATRRR